MFDKAKFSLLLEKAIGDRTTTEYANQSGVNRTYISKLLNKRMDNPPSPDILKRLAENAHNGVTYEDFMLAAGYIINSENIDNDEDKKAEIFWQRLKQEIKKQGLDFDETSPEELVKVYKILIDYNKKTKSN